MTAEDRITLNEPGEWSGPDYAIGLVDELVMSDAVVHLEMLSDSSAYLAVYRGDRWVHLNVWARPTTRAERRQILASSGDRLPDHLSSLNPSRWGASVFWSVPVWRRPAAVVSGWWEGRAAARAVLCVRLDEDHDSL